MAFRNTGEFARATFRKGGLAVLEPTVLEPTQAPATIGIRGDGTSRNQSAAIEQTGNIATYSRTAHGLSPNDWVLISNAVETEYNGWFRVLTVPTADTFTYQISGNPSSPSTGTSRIDISVDESRSFGMDLVASMADNGTGAYQVNFANTQADASFGSVGMALHTTTNPANLDITNESTTIAILQRTDAAGAGLDGAFYVLFYGVG